MQYGKTPIGMVSKLNKAIIVNMLVSNNVLPSAKKSDKKMYNNM